MTIHNLLQKLHINSNIVEDLHTNLDPSYKKQKTEARTNIALGKCYLAAVNVASIAMNILGLSLCVAGGWASAIGTPILMIGLPLCFFAINFYKVLDNATTVLESQIKYHNLIGAFDRSAFRQDLLAGTLGVSWAVDYFISQIEAQFELLKLVYDI